MWQPCACFPGFPQPPGHVAALSPTGYIEREVKRERERQDKTRRNKTRPDQTEYVQWRIYCKLSYLYIYIHVCVCNKLCIYIYINKNKCIALSLYLCMWLINRGDTAMGKIKLYKSTRRAFALSLATASSAPFNKAAA